jgi:hypothetical protein
MWCICGIQTYSNGCALASILILIPQCCTNHCSLRSAGLASVVFYCNSDYILTRTPRLPLCRALRLSMCTKAGECRRTWATFIKPTGKQHEPPALSGGHRWPPLNFPAARILLGTPFPVANPVYPVAKLPEKRPHIVQIFLRVE